MYERFIGSFKIINFFGLKMSKILKLILNWLLNNVFIICVLFEIFEWVSIIFLMVYFMNFVYL